MPIVMLVFLNNEVFMDFSEKLTEIMAIKGLSQQQLSDRTNISKSLISQYKSGITSPSYSNARLIADVVGSSVDWLLSDNWLELSEDMREQQLIKNYRKLNENGKSKIDENINDLLELDRYLIIYPGISEIYTLQY